MGEDRGCVHNVERAIPVRKPVGISPLPPLRVIDPVVYVGDGEVKVWISRVDVILSEFYLIRSNIEALVPTRRLKVVQEGQHCPAMRTTKFHDRMIYTQFAQQRQISSSHRVQQTPSVH